MVIDSCRNVYAMIKLATGSVAPTS